MNLIDESKIKVSKKTISKSYSYELHLCTLKAKVEKEKEVQNQLTCIEFMCGPILVALLLNLRRGIRANGSSNESIICKAKPINYLSYV